MKVLYFLVNLHFFFLLKVEGQLFCFVLCGTGNSNNNCQTFTYDKCQTCANGFQKDTNSNQYACIAQSTTNYLTTTSARYQPIGVTDDITYNLMSNLSVVTMTINSTAAVTKMQCKKDNSNDYWYYGNQSKTDTYTLSHSGVTDIVGFWKVRLRYFVITIDKIDNGANLKTTFTTNTTEPSSNISVANTAMLKCRKLCATNNDFECYKIIDV